MVDPEKYDETGILSKMVSDLGDLVEEETARAFVFDTGVELSDIVDAINAVGAGASDLVEILTALREAGALRAEIIII